MTNDASKILALMMAKIDTPITEPFEREYRFHETRRFRFDIAFPAIKLAVEVHGQFSKGKDGKWKPISGHTTKQGMDSDLEKKRIAILSGWRVLEFSAQEAKKRPIMCIDVIRQTIRMIKADESAA